MNSILQIILVFGCGKQCHIKTFEKKGKSRRVYITCQDNDDSSSSSSSKEDEEANEIGPSARYDDEYAMHALVGYEPLIDCEFQCHHLKG